MLKWLMFWRRDVTLTNASPLHIKKVPAHQAKDLRSTLVAVTVKNTTGYQYRTDRLDRAAIAKIGATAVAYDDMVVREIPGTDFVSAARKYYFK